MTANRELPHLLILPEDDANRQIANGFCLRFGTRQIQILNEAGGWWAVCNRFADEYVAYMRRYPLAHMVLVVDFDGQAERSAVVQAHVPSDLKDRVFVVGASTEPEALKRAGLGRLEEIGIRLADDCPPASGKIWSHALLAHNADEIARFRSRCSNLLR